MGNCSSSNRRNTYNNSNRRRVVLPVIVNRAPQVTPTICDDFIMSDINSNISCNFIYDENNDTTNLISCIGAVLSILAISLQDEYDICCICTDRIATISTKKCNHRLLCSLCYSDFCISTVTKCPICRVDLDLDDPFTL